jgi:serine/threonine-protein kinase RsbW
MPELPNVTLRLVNRPDNVLLVRQTLSGLADAVGLDEVALNDVNTAVTEACNNVVLHAYDGEEGPLEVDVQLGPSRLEVLVRDRGRGIKPKAKSSELADGGIGLPVMHALASEVQLRDLGDDGGTEVGMRFELVGTTAMDTSIAEDGAVPTEIARPHLPDAMQITVAPTPLARAVLPRVLCSLAARAHFSTDRISDTQLLADTLMSQLDGSVFGDRLDFGIGVAPRELELLFGPLHAGRGEALLEASTVAGLGPVIERLTDAHEVASAGDERELLSLHLRQPAH